VATLNWTAEAERWLGDIFEYIAADNPAAAAETVQSIYDHAQALIDHPKLGYRYTPSTRSIRILLSGHYRIAYLILGDGDIDILGVFHGALDISRYEL
jgi:toxin ParE1/3/4